MNKFFNLAKTLSLKSTHPKAKIGSVLVYKNRVISLGVNELKTHPKSNHPFNMLHAEMDAIFSCNNIKQYKYLELYVYRELANGKIATSFPCNSCMNMIKCLGNIYKIHYTDYDGYKVLVL